MKFIALIIALVFLQYRGSAAPMHRDGWYHALVGWLDGLGLARAPALVLAVLAPALLLAAMMHALGGELLGLPGLLISILVLLYSFGRGNYDELVEKYREYCRAGDFEAARAAPPWRPLRS